MNPSAQGQAKAGGSASPILIRVDQVPKLPHLNDQEKAQTQSRVQQLWDIMNNNAETDIRRRQAHQHLTAISQQIMQAMRAYNEQQKQSQSMRLQAPTAPQRSHTSPVPMQSQVQPHAQPQIQTQTQPVSQPAGVSTSAAPFLPEVQQQLDVYPFCLPPAMTQGTKQADEWLKEAKTRFGSALQRMQQAKTQKANLQRMAVTKQQQGGLSVTEQNTFNDKISQFNKYIAESQTFLEKFREQQTQFKTQRAQQASSVSNVEQQRQQASGAASSTLQQSVSAVQQQTAGGVTSPGPGHGPTAPGQVTQQQTHSLPTTPGATQPVGYPTTTNQQQQQQQQQRLQYPNSAGSGALAAPGATTQHSTQPQQPMQPAGQAHASRPGFNGSAGHGAQRSMTEPTLSAISGYALDQSEDGTVLSRKKLKELIGEVLGRDNDGLTPDAEDLCIQFVDDFVDDIISQGCKIAKLRGSSHLDARDIQVVLERQYNIRIPGFSTDELRVARRPQPAPGWTQKSSAVNSSN